MTAPRATSLYASVVLLRVQEFARRPVSEQARLRAQLEAVVAVTAAEVAASDRIVLDAADGAAIVVLGDPQGALRLAEHALSAGAAGLPLCAGVNHGAVQVAGDGLAGDGIAVAASVAQFAVPGRLLATRAFRDALAEAAPGREAGLAAAGSHKDAGLRAHEVFGRDRNAPHRRDLRYLVASAAVMLALIGGGLALRVATEGQQHFTDRMAAAVRGATAQGERWLRSLLDKAKF